MIATESVTIAVPLPADRVWEALRGPARLWQTFPGAGRPAPVDGIMNGTVKPAGDEAPEWRYQIRMLDRDDERRTVHFDIRALPIGHVGSAHLSAGIEVRDQGEQTVLMLSWHGSANGDHQTGSEAWVAAVRHQVPQIVHRAVAAAPPQVARPRLEVVLETLQRLLRGRWGLVMAVAGAAAAIAILFNLARLRRRPGGPR